MVINSRRIKNGLKFVLLEIRKSFRRVLGKPVIEVIGDSHSLLFQSEHFNINYIGPATAHRLSSPASSTSGNQKIEQIINRSPNKKRIFLFVFGEIDARIHIYKVAKEKGISESEAILQTVSNYTSYVHDLQIKYPNNIFMIFNILPQGEQGNFYNYKYYADRDTRVKITKELNAALKYSCKQNQIPFIEVFNELVDGNSHRKKELIFDEIHFSDKIIPYIIPRVKKVLQEQGIEL